MANRWVEFVRKWAKDHKMNYMCAMTTKECKDAYLKAYPKEPKKAKGGLPVDALRKKIGILIADMANLGNPWSGSDVKIDELALKRKINITNYLVDYEPDDYDGIEMEIGLVENILDALEGKDTKKNRLFLQDIIDLIEGYKSKAEQDEMAKADVPAPASKKNAKKTYDVDGIIDKLDDLMNNMAGFKKYRWSRSNDKIKELAKKHKLNISKWIEGSNDEQISADALIENFDGAKTEHTFLFFKDLYNLLDGYRRDAEQAEMAGEDTPAPAPKAKKVIIKVPKKTKKPVMGETNTQPELVKMILDDMKKKGVPIDTGDRTVIRKQKPDIKKVEDRLDAGEDIREALKGLVDLYDKELLGKTDSKKVEELVEKFNIKKRAEKAKKKD